MFYKITKEQAELIGKFDFGKNQKFDPFVGEQKDGSFLVSEKMYTLLKEHGALKKVDFKNKTTVTKQSLDFEIKTAEVKQSFVSRVFNVLGIDKTNKVNKMAVNKEVVKKKRGVMNVIGICIFLTLITGLTISLFTETASGIDVLIYIFAYLICITGLTLLIRDK